MKAEEVINDIFLLMKDDSKIGKEDALTILKAYFNETCQRQIELCRKNRNYFIEKVNFE